MSQHPRTTPAATPALTSAPRHVKYAVTSVSADGSLGYVEEGPNCYRVQIPGDEPITVGCRHGSEFFRSTRPCPDSRKPTIVSGTYGLSSGEHPSMDRVIAGPIHHTVLWRDKVAGLRLSGFSRPIPTTRESLEAEANTAENLGLKISAEMLREKAASLPETQPDPNPYPLGTVWQTHQADELCQGQPRGLLAGFLARHQAGDFGLFGLADDAPDNAAAKLFPQLFGTACENVQVRRAGEGIVRSRYEVFAKPNPHDPEAVLGILDYVLISTIYYLDGEAPRTVIGLLSRHQAI
jgi:hypothetical protein